MAPGLKPWRPCIIASWGLNAAHLNMLTRDPLGFAQRRLGLPCKHVWGGMHPVNPAILSVCMQI